ncbi:MAG: GerMN domain-containing protein [Halanaerobiales bacterium]|nr:GerMN domain-containing protein [Halanaerobiales bacterium]
MKNRIFKFIIMLIIFIAILGVVYYFIAGTNLIVKEKSIDLYFSTKDAMYLAAENRTIKGRNLYKEAVNALIDGPTDPNLSKTIPKGTKVLNVSRNNDRIKINFSKEIIENHWGGSTGERLTVYSIVNTLSQFDKIREVKFLIEGEEVDTLVGHMDLSRPLEPSENILKPKE